MEKKVDAKILQKQMDLQEASFRPSKVFIFLASFETNHDLGVDTKKNADLYVFFSHKS